MKKANASQLPQTLRGIFNRYRRRWRALGAFSGLLLSIGILVGTVGASVIAEGVETEEEALVLADAGAHYGQGFLFARPTSCPEEMAGRVP